MIEMVAPRLDPDKLFRASLCGIAVSLRGDTDHGDSSAAKAARSRPAGGRLSESCRSNRPGQLDSLCFAGGLWFPLRKRSWRSPFYPRDRDADLALTGRGHRHKGRATPSRLVCLCHSTVGTWPTCSQHRPREPAFPPSARLSARELEVRRRSRAARAR